MPGRIGIIGGGPGGLTSAMLLASKGFNVTLFEANKQVGGRNSELVVGQSKFDVGPTIVMMKFVLDEVFKDAGRNSSDYLNIIRLNPMYRLQYGPNRHIDCYDSKQKDKMVAEMQRVFPKDVDGYKRYLEFEEGRFEKVLPMLQKPYHGYRSLLNMDSIRALPHVSLGNTMFRMLGKYYEDPLAKLSFSFQAKYLGMSAYDCPAFFGMIPYVEHAFGCYHVEGGLNKISHAMAKVVGEYGGSIRLGDPVKTLTLDGRKVTGLITEKDEEFKFDEVVVNADFFHWKPSKTDKRKFSCSTFMVYIHLNKVYPELEHNTISFADDYESNMKSISGHLNLPDDFSVYICNPSKTDASMSAPGTQGLYCLVPVPNLHKVTDDWSDPNIVEAMKQKVYKHLEERCGCKDIRDHVVAEKVMTPLGWRDEVRVHKGATFSMAHSLFQMLLWRPRNRFEELDNLYLSGAGTHPGSGLPTIWEAGRIVTHLLCEKYGVNYDKARYTKFDD
ncbi:phytoene desaturase [Acrasis kona]|uniref:Phytoene desaturase n=1 Tax=Acrasis kona TaxID=1008807 RepID=A0AAW2YGK2_9EUKA